MIVPSVNRGALPPRFAVVSFCRAGWLTAALLAIFLVVAAALAAVFLLPEGGMQDITDNSEGGAFPLIP